MPTITVQIVTYNSEKYINDCLESVRAQSYPITNIIVIDNASDDSTVEIVEKHDDILLVKNQNNNGFAGGHNQALQLSSSDYVLVLNPDVCLHSNYIEEIIKVMEINPSIGMGTGKLYRDYKKRLLDSTGIIIKKNRRAFDRGTGQIDNGQFDKDVEIFGVSGAAALYRRQMIEDISINNQFFDESFFAYKEDVDVSWRARIFGWNSIFVPNAIAEHKRGWNEQKKRSDVPMKIRKHSYINRYYCILKNDHLLYILLHLPAILIYEFIILSYAVLKERELLKAWTLFKNEYSNMILKRKKIQRARRTSLKNIYKFFRGIW
ncbi:glycosyltransferase family 2 protein [Geobacillus zalihae]|uniref:glycosyltransferase family 2 protein n=1 Tax=Geobacillus zalihae TaxID=213419 RepID=UPI0026227DEB|nr:glycosyltransferase family 2 protein [Geobacillus zalihae]WKA47184.1 glycosyltransferase family 2 protein [Geobacillus zalihae]